MSPAAARRVSATVRGWVKKFLYDASCFGFSGRCFPGMAGVSPGGKDGGRRRRGPDPPVLRWSGGNGREVRGRTNGWMGLILEMIGGFRGPTVLTM